ncbi:MAG: hypothetical protein IKN55_03830 [Oscillospiraceae bacterium]|nr:hypothetical protein [Oscillospiraceae bacterium]
MSESIKKRLQRLEKLFRGMKPDDEDNFVLCLVGEANVETYRKPDGTLDWMRALNDTAVAAWNEDNMEED